LSWLVKSGSWEKYCGIVENPPIYPGRGNPEKGIETTNIEENSPNSNHHPIQIIIQYKSYQLCECSSYLV
jgi:hypothetical protein